MNLRLLDETSVGIALDETTTVEQLAELYENKLDELFKEQGLKTGAK